jgi:phosphatidylglycerophosphate synthase
MESISELREKCQGCLHVKEADTRYAALVARKVSIYFTWLLLHTQISANQTTFLFIILGLIGSACFIPGTFLFSLIGALVLQVWFIFDCVDGEIARYRGTSSVTGSYFDLMAHDIVNSSLFLCLSCGVYNGTASPIAGSAFCFVFGFSAVFSLFLIKLTWLNKVRVLLIEGRHSENKDTPGEGSFELGQVSSSLGGTGSGLQRLYAKVSFLFRFPGIMNIICVAAIFERIDVFLIVYGLILPPLWIVMIYRSVTRGIVNTG